jgi:PPOX class probable FMN-dependent enzyme
MPPWRANIQNALDQNLNKAESRYMQLATMDSQQQPSVRTIVFRGFLENTSTLIMHTDQRSEKVAQISEQPRAQICWYFADSREQFRLSGTLEIVAPLHEYSAANVQLREAHWHQLSEAAKPSYHWPAPGTTLISGQNPLGSADVNNDHISEHFALLLLNIDTVDHLQLTPSPHQRCIYTIVNNQWKAKKLNP